MTDISRSAISTGASPLFLREDEIRRGVELLYFGYTRLTNSIDQELAKQGLGRAHHRALYFIARQPGLTVGELLQLLAITKQSLGRVLKELHERDLVLTKAGQVDRRQKLLHLTKDGAALEAELFRQLREKLSSAYVSAGQESVTGFWHVLEGLIPESDRKMIFDLRKENLSS
ncbi:HTH-type transcriptional regulator PetP [hydrothermal vent metagenome]|uniref:HTH-type transcriptional regulator PetP n=1 Tax=hydrothermal vent metagenome TaxID=652676 RepID=A0A3B0SFZ0_9ZZZZ